MRYPRPIIIPGTRYGHLVTTGVYISGYTDKNCGVIRSTLECKCDCGIITYKQLSELKKGNTKSCSKKCPYSGKISHGLAKSYPRKKAKEYQAWITMKFNCDNPNATTYKYYGGKGITYHDSLSTIQGFLEVMGFAPSKYHRFTRIDKEGDFEPGNIHWYLADGKKKK